MELIAAQYRGRARALQAKLFVRKIHPIKPNSLFCDYDDSSRFLYISCVFLYQKMLVFIGKYATILLFKV